jgi:plastocyanin
MPTFIIEVKVSGPMAPKRVSLFTAAALAVLIAFAVPMGASAATVQVHLAAGTFAFSPANTNISAGDTVEFVNDDTMAHDVTFEAGFNSGAAGAFAPGAHYNHTFATNGTFKFRCTIHSTDFASGMVGVVQVGPVATAPPAQTPKSPGFETLGALAAIGAAAVVVLRRRG